MKFPFRSVFNIILIVFYKTFSSEVGTVRVDMGVKEPCSPSKPEKKFIKAYKYIQIKNK